MFSWQQVNMNFFNIVLILKICDNSLWTKSYWFIGCFSFHFYIFSSTSWKLIIHFLCNSFLLMCVWYSFLNYLVRWSLACSTRSHFIILSMMDCWCIWMNNNISPNLVSQTFKQSWILIECFVQIQC